MKALVLGGTRFFGKRLVELLIAGDHEVTLATRGRTPDPFGEGVDRIIVDRENAADLSAKLAGRSWDVVYDQICYASDAAEALLAALGDRAGHLVFMSTGAVYDFTGRPLTEPEFDPTTYPQRTVSKDYDHYGEYKRLAEAAYFQRASYPVSAMRFPVVIGPDDYTTRMQDFIARIRDGKEIGVKDVSAIVSFVSANDAARQLLWAGVERAAGVWNGSSGPVTVRRLLNIIETNVGREAVLSPTYDPEQTYRMDTSSALDTSKAKAAGFVFEDTLESSIAELCS